MRTRSHGFTLIEMLLVLALIGMFASVLIVNVDSLVRQTESEAIEHAFWEAARHARTDALLTRQVETVRYDERAMAFVIDAPGAPARKRFAIDRKELTGESRPEIAFMKRLPKTQFSLVGGSLVDMRRIPSVQFYPDGTCTPFVLQFEIGRDERTIEIDPWTGAELLPENET